MTKNPLRINGFDCDAYLDSSRWKTLRFGLIELRGSLCESCGKNENLHAHHKTYERFGKERPEDLVVLCQKCHSAVHQIERTTRLTLREATELVLRPREPVQKKQRRLSKTSAKERRERSLQASGNYTHAPKPKQQEAPAIHRGVSAADLRRVRGESADLRSSAEAWRAPGKYAIERASRK